MRRAIIFALLLLFPTVLHARVIKWEGKPISIAISTERLTRIEFLENLRSVFLSRSDIAVEKEETSLYIRALTPEIEDTLFVVGESGTTYELNLSTTDSPIKPLSSLIFLNSFRFRPSGRKGVIPFQEGQAFTLAVPRHVYEVS